MGKIRALKIGLEQRIVIKIPTSFNIMEWIVELAPDGKDAIWVGVARRSNEHFVVLEQGGQAIRCRSVKRRPEVNKWDAEKIRNIVASPRMPNPEDPSRPDFDIDKTRLPRPAVPAEDVGRAQARLVSEPGTVPVLEHSGLRGGSVSVAGATVGAHAVVSLPTLRVHLAFPFGK